MKLNSLLALLVSVVLFSCTASKHQNYFTIYGIDSSHTYVHQSYEVPIQVGDRLAITVSALNPVSAIPYNLPGVAAASGGAEGVSGGSAGPAGIVVESDGKILYPQLGPIQVEGLTVTQVRDLLLTRLKPYLTDPVVSVNLVNFKVTVIGEVGGSKTIMSPDGRLNILEALAQAGDLTLYAKRYPVMIIRENKGRREFGYVNLLSNSIFSSPYYRLQQNDIIYVQAVDKKPTADEQHAMRRFTLITTVATLVTTLTFAVISLTR